MYLVFYFIFFYCQSFLYFSVANVEAFTCCDNCVSGSNVHQFPLSHHCSHHSRRSGQVLRNGRILPTVTTEWSLLGILNASLNYDNGNFKQACVSRKHIFTQDWTPLMSFQDRNQRCHARSYPLMSFRKSHLGCVNLI